MKVLYAVTRCGPGGVQTHVLDLIEGFAGKYDVHLATGEPGYLSEGARALGARCHFVPELAQGANPLREAKAAGRFLRLLREIKADLVHAHTTKAGLAARAAAWRCGIPSVYTAHSWVFSQGVRLGWKALGAPSEWLAARATARIINVCDANRRLAIRFGLPASQQVTIHNGVADTKHRARPDRALVPEIIATARFVPRMHHQLLLEAFAAIDLPATLTLVGGGPSLPWMRALCSKLGVGGRVRFLGERTDVAELLAKASVFALASRWEGFPLSVLEAMRAGLPVVASDVGGTHEAVTSGENGYLVARGDVAGFRNALGALCRDACLRARMGAAARRRYEDEFSVRQMLTRTELLYQQVWRERGMWREGESPGETGPKPAVREIGLRPAGRTAK